MGGSHELHFSSTPRAETLALMLLCGGVSAGHASAEDESKRIEMFSPNATPISASEKDVHVPTVAEMQLVHK